MFGTDPARSLNKARKLLAGGDALSALRLARKAQRRARPPLSGEIAAFAEEARRAVVAAAEARAEASAAEGFYDDAAEWLRGGIDHAEGEDERARLAARVRELEMQAEEAAEHPLDGPGDRSWAVLDGHSVSDPDDREKPPGRIGARDMVRAVGSLAGSVPVLKAPSEVGASADREGGSEVAEATLFEIYVDSLRDDVAERYRDRAPELSERLVDVVEPAAADQAAAAVEEMAAASPDDPVLRLERARWRLAKGETAAAREDLEVAWASFGDEPLDLGGNLSIPVMWCEAALTAGDHAAVLERLEERGELTLDDPELSLYYAKALLAAGEDAEARDFLAESHDRFPRRTDIAHLLAVILHRGGAASGAAAVLERSLRACGRGCSPKDLHPPLLRLLATIYAEAGGPVERLGDVLLLLRGSLGGEFEPADWRLQARYHDLAGEPEAAERARARAGGVPAGVRSTGEGPPPAPAYEES